MPRERVHHGTKWVKKLIPETNMFEDGFHPYHDGLPLESTDVLTQDQSLDISWHRDGWVQVAMAIPKEKWDRIVQQFTDYPDDEPNIYTDVLSRQEINNMIKTLRRARDQAYGADE